MVDVENPKEILMADQLPATTPLDARILTVRGQRGVLDADLADL